MYWKGSPGEGEESCQSICIRDYADSKNDLVINHAIGTTFDMLHEAYDFYSLYSWEHGFGIRYAKSRLNVQRTKCMQEIVCGCAGKHLADNIFDAFTQKNFKVQHGNNITKLRKTAIHDIMKLQGNMSPVAGDAL